MRNTLYLFIFIIFFASCSNNKDYRKLESNNDSTSYSLGLLFASKMPKNLKENNVDSISFKHFLQGINDYFESAETPVLTKEQSQALIQLYFEKIQNLNQKSYADNYKQNSIDGNIFLDNNVKKPNIIELKKGLQYQVNYSGWGSLKPDVRDTILVHFKMYSITNKLIYDSRSKSYDPIKIALDSTIQAWQEILPLYNTGAKLKIFTSHEFAYGIDVTKEDIIEPYQTLIFDLELVKTIKGNYPGATTEIEVNKNDSIKQ